MADCPPSSSQDSIYEQHRIVLDQENVDSSPIKYGSKTLSSETTEKQRKPPTVTPKRFKKFFTPRNVSSTKRYRQGKSGQQLRDITKNGVNRRPAFKTVANDILLVSDDDFPSLRSPKRRKLSLDITSSPPISSPIKHLQTSRLIADLDDSPPSPTFSEAASLPDLLQQCKPFPKPVQKLGRPGYARRILERSFGGFDTLSRGRRGADHGGSLVTETANFATVSSDLHAFQTVSLPFCTTACNTNSLVAVGDEEGRVRLIDSSPTADFSLTHVCFRAHHNAVMDIAFSSDDFLLATASGDQSSRIIDMHTQQTTCILTGHMGTVKQVRFSPLNDNMVYTSSKDGTVQIWDLRCREKHSVQSLRNSSGDSLLPGERLQPEARYSKAVLQAYQGHRLATRPLIDATRPELSITAFEYLPSGREHLILTASEVNASIKLWDLRNAGRRSTVPLSSTPVPASHNRSRNFGINALAMSGDGGRLYAVCRDATVYAYSTSQLALGCVPELSEQPSRRRMLTEANTGAAPLYGFRHPSLRLGSFYIKASLRPSHGDRSEILAVGSTESCPILFPTDERHLQQRNHSKALGEDNTIEYDVTELPTMPPISSQQAVTNRLTANPTTPIYPQGTALIRGHRHEVTSVSWTHEGDLVSVSDDFTARCWREDAEKARQLRTCGEGGGQRWHSGWADIDPAWDEDEI